MPSLESDTTLIGRLVANRDSQSCQEVWQRYFARLVAIARNHLRNAPRRTRDEEDVALSAFDSFFRGLDRGHFPRLDDREDLWQILVMLTERKAIDQIRRDNAAKRGGGLVRGDSAFVSNNREESPGGLDEVNDAGPSPELAAIFSEECQRLLNMLGDPELRTVAILKMEGFNNAEIAQRLNRVTRSIDRKLRAIRNLWLDDREALAHESN